MLTKRIRKSGSIGIPVKYRRILNINADDAVDMKLEGDSVVITAHNPRCIFCNSYTNIKKIKGKMVCTMCVQDIVKQEVK